MILYHISPNNFDGFIFQEPFYMDTRYTGGAMVYFAHSLKECIDLCEIETDFYLYTVEIDEKLLYTKYGNIKVGEVVVNHDTIDHLLEVLINENGYEDVKILMKMLYEEISEGKPVTNNKFFKILKKEFIKKEAK